MALHLSVTGDGPLVVLTHGVGDSSATWEAIVPALAADHQVVAWDLRGHGGSPLPEDGDYGRDDAVADLVGIVDEHGGTADVVGHSLGGYLSLALAIRHPEKVRTLTLLSSGPGFRDAAARNEWNRSLEQRGSAAVSRQEDSSVIDGVAGLDLPLLLMVGERDTTFHAGMAYLAKRVAGARHLVIDGAGHNPQRSHADLVSREILAHIG